MTIALVMSIKKAPTIGTTRNARSRRAEAVRDRLHVGNRGRRGAEAEAAVPGGKYRRVVIPDGMVRVSLAPMRDTLSRLGE